MKERTGGGGKFIRLCGETTTDRKTLPPPCKEYGGVALRPIVYGERNGDWGPVREGLRIA